MLGHVIRTVAAVFVASTVCASALPAAADGIGNVYEQQVLPGANTAIKNILNQQQQARDRARRQASVTNGATVSQAPPVSQEPVEAPEITLPRGLTYTADLSMAYPFGNIGTYGKQGWLMGAGDLSVGYGFNWSTRLVASVYQLQHWPYGFNVGKVPVYLAGFRNPVGCADLTNGNACGAGAGRNINVRTQDTFGVFMLQKMFVIKSDALPGPIPFVITPVYVARSGKVGFSPNNNDVVPFTYNLPDGPVVNIPVRTAQYYSVAITLPFVKSPKMFATFTLAPQWLVHTAGANVGNSMQLGQVLYLEYTPTKTTTLFFEPQSARDYLPTDPYPEHLIAYFLGVSQRLSKYAFVQVMLNSGGPTNEGPDGVTAIKCLTVQQVFANQCGLAIGGLRATQLQLQFGVGSPSVFPL
ncbi:MAG TPA: hypothetical protein VFE35_05645 [Candidatus Cybelea sp.]|jgi:hypothetical protein|nr:hypothetical protein [Candidatus Cybelea sp.]